jgi:hypothetical protein
VTAEPLGSDTSGLGVPDLIEPVVGYREWVLIGEDIFSPLARTLWTTEPVKAECLPGPRRAGGLWREPCDHRGPAPDPDCVCGIYALFGPQPHRNRDRLGLVRGAVALWGRIEVHEEGMRAEFARVVALTLPSFPPRPGGQRVTRRVAGRLGIEAVPASQLREAALAHGQSLPPSLIPT